MFHRDLEIKYLHDSSFASVYTAKLANPKYSAFTSTRLDGKRDGLGRRGRERAGRSGASSGVRVTGLVTRMPREG